MRNLIYILILLCLSSCYEDYVKDFDYNGVYFTRQNNVRSLVVGETSQIQFGVVIGGLMENDKNRTVEYSLDNSLLTEQLLSDMKASEFLHVREGVELVDELLPMPSDWYKISDNGRFVIKKGMMAGINTITFDMDKLLSNSEMTKDARYCIPFKIESADADTILASKATSVLALQYECKLFGFYYHSGRWVSFDSQGNKTGEQSLPFRIPMPDGEEMECVTYAPYSVLTNKVANMKGTGMIITLNNDNSVLLEAPEGSDYTIETIEGKYNNPKLLQDRKLFLKYKVNNSDGSYIEATDTLTFRNRIRDGVNEWRDENSENYK